MHLCHSFDLYLKYPCLCGLPQSPHSPREDNLPWVPSDID